MHGYKRGFGTRKHFSNHVRGNSQYLTCRPHSYCTFSGLVSAICGPCLSKTKTGERHYQCPLEASTHSCSIFVMKKKSFLSFFVNVQNHVLTHLLIRRYFCMILPLKVKAVFCPPFVGIVFLVSHVP